MRGLFVTGSDTGVGKTVVSAALMRRFSAALYWKPIQTGIEDSDDAAEVRRLSGRDAGAVRTEGIRLLNPVSPHLAAQRAGVRIDLDDLTEWTTTTQDPWIVEGAGGVLVPLNDTQTMLHLMVRLGLPVLVVARTTLGTINHTLMTLEAIRARSLTVAGIVMVGDRSADNRAAIERYGKTRVLGEMPVFDPLTPASLARWAEADFDSQDRLTEFFE